MLHDPGRLDAAGTHGWSPLRIAVTLLISYSAVILLSFIIGYAAERSRSLVVAVSLHCYIDVLLNNLDLYIPLLLALPIWALLTVDLAKGCNRTSVITSKAANGYHFKTGQRNWPPRNKNVLPCRLLFRQVEMLGTRLSLAHEAVGLVQISPTIY
jgi:hypothetical protein